MSQISKAKPWFRQPKNMPDWLYHYFGETIKPLITKMPMTVGVWRNLPHLWKINHKHLPLCGFTPPMPCSICVVDENSGPFIRNLCGNGTGISKFPNLQPYPNSTKLRCHRASRQYTHPNVTFDCACVLLCPDT